jgi:hypothetical protein
MTPRVMADLRGWWYGGEAGTDRRPHPVQERFLFGGWVGEPHKSPRYRGLAGGRRLGKTVALTRLAFILALINGSGDPADPVWGGIYGRNLREVDRRIIQPLLRLCREFSAHFGVDFSARYNRGAQEIRFSNGSGIFVGSYGKLDSLQQQRGDTLGWAIVDEIEQSRVSAEEVLAVIGVAISDRRAGWGCFGWASTPNGLRGMMRLHHDAAERKDPQYYLVTGTIRDNPYLDEAQIAAIRAGLSSRMWQQEGMGVCLSSRNVVFPEFDAARHVVDHAWEPEESTVIAIDWGTTHGYVCAIKVSASGVWTVAREVKTFEFSVARFRGVVDDFLTRCVNDDRGRWPALIATDGAVMSENSWIRNKYGHLSWIRWLKRDWEQGIEWGLNLVSYMLDPADGSPPKLLFSRDLDTTTDPERMGIRGAMVTYGWATGRSDAGDDMTLPVPSKRTNADHPVDAVRYALCLGRRMPELHGGAALAFTDSVLDDAASLWQNRAG